MVKTPEPIKTPALVARITQEQQLQAKPKPLARGQQMDIADKIAAAASRANCSIEQWIMNQPGARWEPQPSERNNAPAGGLAGLNSDLTFARAGAKYASSNYMKSRRVGY
jgi:hypothetical protein